MAEASTGRSSHPKKICFSAEEKHLETDDEDIEYSEEDFSDSESSFSYSEILKNMSKNHKK